MRSSSHIALDLSSKSVFKALVSLEGMTKRMQKIKTAEVFTSRPNVGIHSSLSAVDIVKIFSIMGAMPHLKHVKVNLNQPHHFGSGALPLAALTRLFAGASRLRSLELCQLEIRIQYSTPTSTSSSSNGNGDYYRDYGSCSAIGSTTTTTTSTTSLIPITPMTTPANTATTTTLIVSTKADMRDFEMALTRHKHFHTVEVLNCMDVGIGLVVASIAKHANYLRRCRVVGTPLTPWGIHCLTKAIGASASSWSSSDKNQHYHPLEALLLEDVTDITDGQMESLALELAHPYCTLQELNIRSSILTEKAGEALTDMLFLNHSIHTLSLHLDCELLSFQMADCLRINTRLQNVDLRCYGDDEAVSQSVVRIAQALTTQTATPTPKGRSLPSSHSPQQQPSQLKRLRLCLEIEPYEFQQEILDAFADTLKHNTSLGELILHDGLQPYPLTEEMQLQLRLNHCGYSKCITRRDTNRVSESCYIDAVAAEHPLYSSNSCLLEDDSSDGSRDVAGCDPSSNTNTNGRGDLDVVYTILRNHPELVVGAAAVAAAATTTTRAAARATTRAARATATTSTTTAAAAGNGSKTTTKKTPSFASRSLSPFSMKRSTRRGKKNSSQSHPTAITTTTTASAHTRRVLSLSPSVKKAKVLYPLSSSSSNSNNDNSKTSLRRRVLSILDF